MINIYGRSFAGLIDRGNSAADAGGIETMHRLNLNEIAGAAGKLWINYATAAVTTTVSQLTVGSSGTAAVNCTLARMGLFTVAVDGSVTLVARTASQTSIGDTTFTPFQFSLSTTGGFPDSYTVYAGQRYAMGFLQLADTAMSVTGAYLFNFTAPPVPCRSIGAQTDIDTEYAVGDLSAEFFQCYMAARP